MRQSNNLGSRETEASGLEGKKVIRRAKATQAIQADSGPTRYVEEKTPEPGE